MAEGAGASVVLVKPCPRADPEEALGILCQRKDLAVAQAEGVASLVEMPAESLPFSVKFVQPAAGADPQGPCAILQKRQNIVVAEAMGIAILMRVPDERRRPCRGVQRVQATRLRPNPQDPLGILPQGGDIVAAQAVGVLSPVPVCCELPGLPVEPAEPAAMCTDPQPALRVLEERCDMVAGKAARVIWIVLEGSPLSGSPLEPVETMCQRPDPQHVLGIYENRADRDLVQAWPILLTQRVGAEHLRPLVEAHQSSIRAQPERVLRIIQNGTDDVRVEAGRVGRVVAIDGERVAIVLVETILGADPQVSLAILEHSHDLGLGKPVFKPQPFEAGDVALYVSHLAHLLVCSAGWARPRSIQPLMRVL